MLKKNDIKLIRSLRIKKYRQKYNKFIVEGEKIIIEALKIDSATLDALYCTKDFYQLNKDLISTKLSDVNVISEKELKQISNLKTANSALALIKIKENTNFEKLKEARLILFLDEIMDPGNMGTIIRSCDWFGVDALVISPNSVDIYNPKVIQSSMGSIFRQVIFQYDFGQLQEFLSKKEVTYYGTKLEGDNIQKVKYNFPSVIIIGNESHGISAAISNKIDYNITIPNFNKSTESLNAAIATAIVLYDVKNKFD